MTGPTMALALRHLRRADPGLRPLIARHGPPTLKPSRNRLESLTRAIIYQQLSGAAAGTIYRRFLELFGGRFPEAAEIVALSPDTLRSVGLSRGKTEFVRDLAGRFADGAIDPRRFGRMSDEAIIEALTEVKGVGVWTVHMFLLFGLTRPDVLPVGDLGVRRGMQLFFRLRELPLPARMEQLAGPWRPYRSVASWYMWRVFEAGKKPPLRPG